MPKTKTTAPAPSREKGQRSLEPLYLDRRLYPLSFQSDYVNSNAWRYIVRSQNVALACREFLISTFLSLDWKIEPRDSTMRDELKSEIDYYTRFFEYTGDTEYSELIEWVGGDLLDLPFGGCVELGRQSDSPEGKLMWIEPLDGATLFPSLNSDWPVGQKIQEIVNPVYFPAHAINRVYMSPIPEIRRKGWGLAPPEKIYLALQMLNRGDTYYAQLMLDTPDAGILDLLDMSKDSAEEWIKAWREMLTGIDPYKIPVLYEHTAAAKWIPFTRNPAEIQFDIAVSKYGALVCAGYGLSLSDIGLGGGQNGGNTLAGSIRDERRTKRTGFARFKRKMVAWFNRMLPENLEYRLIDLDDEYSVALGRARLANATAWNAYITGNIFTPSEARQQAIQDGLVSISVTEELPKELVDKIEAQTANAAGLSKAERPSMLGRPVSPSSGGWGETTARSLVFDKLKIVEPKYIQRMLYLSYPSMFAQYRGIVDALEDDHQMSGWIDWLEGELYSPGGIDPSKHIFINEAFSAIGGVLDDIINTDEIQAELERQTQEILHDVITGLDENIRQLSYIINGKEKTIPIINSADVCVKLSQSYSKIIPDVFKRVLVSTIARTLNGENQEDYVFNPSVLEEVNQQLFLAMDQLKATYVDNIRDIIENEIAQANKQKDE